MKKNEFYIGYLQKAPKSLAVWLRWVIGGLLLVFALVPIMVATSQDPFAETTFEYGQLTELKGVVSLTPVPRIRITTGQNQRETAVTKSILLVNFGKMGVWDIFQELEKELDGQLSDYELTLAGTLIYGQGKTVFELTNQRAAILGHTRLALPYPQAKSDELGEQSVYGQIIDPKCYFGVMKPGLGKVHRSCAIRCIAGGISPVMVTTDADGSRQFVLLNDGKYGPADAAVARLAGKKITITGQLKQMDDWLVLNYNAQQLTQKANSPFLSGHISLDLEITPCN